MTQNFKNFDLDNDGFLTFDEFKNAILSQAKELNEEEIKQIFELVDKDKNDKIDYKGNIILFFSFKENLSNFVIFFRIY